MDKQEQQVLAKKLLAHCLELPDGVASRQVDALTESQLAAVCEVADVPLHHRRQVLKAVMTTISEAPVAASVPDVPVVEETPPSDAEPSAENPAGE